MIDRKKIHIIIIILVITNNIHYLDIIYIQYIYIYKKTSTDIYIYINCRSFFVLAIFCTLCRFPIVINICLFFFFL